MRYVTKTKRSRRLHSGLILIAVAGLWLHPGSAEAQKWSIDPMIRAGVEYDDNARLDTRTDQEIELEGLLGEAIATVRYDTERTDFELTPRFVIRRYSDNPEFDSEDIFTRGLYRFVGRKNNFRVNLNYDRQEVRLAERSDADLDAEDPDDVPDDTTGRVASGGDRSKWRIRPFWEMRLTANSSFTTEVDYIDVSYSDANRFQLIDYTDLRLNLGYRRSFSEKTTGIVQFSHRTFDRDVELFDSIEGYNAMLGFTHRLSENTRIRALVGFESTDQAILGERTEPVVDVSLLHRLKILRFSAAYRRIVNASGSGQLTVRDSIILNLTRDLNERISAGIGLRAYQSENLNALLEDDRDYVQLRSRFTWFLSRTLALSVDYRYTILGRGELNGETANSNQVNIWFGYRPWRRDE